MATWLDYDDGRPATNVYDTCGCQVLKDGRKKKHRRGCWKGRNFLARWWVRLLCAHEWRATSKTRFVHAFGFKLAREPYYDRWSEYCGKCGASKHHEEQGIT